ncbi:MAG: HPr family phosphocarrier protein [Actinomycetaceae bacterium]|nr:HPr family phosphocarrier protein [Actinomycetaceae bacterium]
MSSVEAVVAASEGLHARPAALFAQAVSATGETVMISKPGAEAVDASSVLALMTLGAKQGETVVLTCEAQDGEKILASLKEMLQTPEG